MRKGPIARVCGACFRYSTILLPYRRHALYARLVGCYEGARLYSTVLYGASQWVRVPAGALKSLKTAHTFICIDCEGLHKGPPGAQTQKPPALLDAGGLHQGGPYIFPGGPAYVRGVLNAP